MAYAFVTLLTSDSYLPGVLNLAHALRVLHPRASHPVPFKLVCLATPETVSERSLRLAAEQYDFVVGVEVLEWEGQAHGLGLLGRHDLALVLTKLHVFRLTEFSKVIFLDADTLPLRPLSHLFALPNEFSAAPDTGWPDCFNSGVMVLTPSDTTFAGLRAMMEAEGFGGGSFDGGDQGILNSYFDGSDGRPLWNRISFTYNVTPTAAYTYAPAYAHYGRDISVVHFIGARKPWHSPTYARPHSAQDAFNDPAKPFDYDALVGRWWSVYNRWVAPRLRVDGGDTGLGQGVLKRLAGGIAGNKEGGYVGLPLDGREDLLRPSQRPPPAPPAIEVERAPSPPPPTEEPASPQWLPLQEGVPYFLPWDPATQDPPKTGAQMSGVFPAVDYKTEWAQPAGASDWVPDVPEDLRYGLPARDAADGSDTPRAAPSNVFPWESVDRPRPTRVFPGETAPPARASAKPNKPRPSVPTLRAGAPAPPAPSHERAQVQPPVKQSFAEAMAGPSRNAWDADPAIQAYASRLQSPPPAPSAALPLAAVSGAGAAHSRSGGGNGRLGRAAEGNRNREQSRDGGADGDDEESTTGNDTDDEGEGEEDVRAHMHRRDGPGGGAGGGRGSNSGFGGSRAGSHAQPTSTSSATQSGHGGHHPYGGSHHAGHQARTHHASRATQTATPMYRHAGTQYSPVARTHALPASVPAGAIATRGASGGSTPSSSRAPSSAETSAVHTPSRAEPEAAVTGMQQAFSTHFAFDLGRKTGGHKRAKSGGRSWDPEREVDAFRDATRRFLGAQ